MALLAGLANTSRVPGMWEFLLDGETAPRFLQTSGGTIGRTREIVLGMARTPILNNEKAPDETHLKSVINNLIETQLE